ncbi:hypothetical protein Fmac_004494 [Flemingia macrophylla]|uniref:Uncharacterized protein n=1 Tax=Flemingia macrophylla TaxID=520843 RepID=A0ABD1N547_9FABA
MVVFSKADALIKFCWHSIFLERIRCLLIKRCNKVLTIVSADTSGNTVNGIVILANLEHNGAIQNFSQLQKSELEDCSKIEELITVRENIQGEKEVLRKLEMLLLVNLADFKTICSNHTLAWSFLEIHNCPKLKTLPLRTDNATNLKTIKGQKDWWDELEWTNNDEVYQRLQPIFIASN